MLYFLLLERFSDDREDRYFDNAGNLVLGGATPLFDPSVDAGNAPPEAWRNAGGGWCGGTLRGLATKLGYLQRLGVTAVWISPVLKQAAFASTCKSTSGPIASRTACTSARSSPGSIFSFTRR